MEDQNREKLEKLKKRMEFANKMRLVFLFSAVIWLLCIFWGGKIWEEAQWFIDVRQKLYQFLWYNIVLLVLCTFAKLILAVRYNHEVRKL